MQAAAVAAAREALEAAFDEQPELRRILDELELPLVPVLADLEATGVALDRGSLDALAETFGEAIARLQEDIYAAVGHEFNLGSPKQLEQVLFYELDLPKGKRTKTGYSTNAPVLEELREAHPMVPHAARLARLHQAQVDLRRCAADAHRRRPPGGCTRPSSRRWPPPGGSRRPTPTCRTSPSAASWAAGSAAPSWPAATDLVLLAADYSQIELRVLAHVSGDVHLKEAFERRADIHRETAARVLKKEPAAITADERSMAKMVNFGLAYGMSDYGLATRAGIPREEARDFIDSYFGAYSGIAATWSTSRRSPPSRATWRRCWGAGAGSPSCTARNAQLRQAGERMAINMPIQGTAADIMKIALIRLHERLRPTASPARMLLSVHDEVLLEVPRGEVEALAPLVREVMEGALTLDVPLDVDVKVGDDWESMTPLERA